MNRALAVGILAAVTGLAFLVALTFFRKGGYSEKESYLVHAYFTDATGLTWKSRMQIAGIQVGEIAEIKLEGARARLDLRVKNEIDLHTDACLVKTFPSALLPDAILEATPGSPQAPLLRDLPVEQREIRCVRQATSVQQLLDSMSQIAQDVQMVTGDLAKTVSGNQGSLREIVENLARITRQVDTMVSTNEDTLTDILHNTRTFTGDLAEISSRDKDKIHAIAKNIEDLTLQLRTVAASVQDIIDPQAGRGGPGAPGAKGPATPGAAAPGTAASPEKQAQAQAELSGVRQAVDRLNGSLAKLDDVMSKVNEGKSVAGRLLTDEKMGRQLASTVDNVSAYVDSLSKLQIQLQLRSEWLLNQTLSNNGRPGSKIYFSARILPRPDKYYLVELVSDPRGVDRVTTTTTDTQVGGVTQRVVTTQKVNEDKLTFSLQLAKRYGPLTFRIGIIEGSGGAGADLHLLDDALQLSASMYQFQRAFQSPTASATTTGAFYPRAKIWANYYFLQHFFVTTGVDDFLNRWQTGNLPGGRSFNIGTDVFFGGGVYFTDDDLKTLIGAGAGSVAGKL
jgi:phospholipid/cholesterol/gamma-HCH transport system substrate-binding protein